MDRALAVTVALAVHVAVLMLALRPAPDARIAPASDAAALEITWVKRRAAPVPDPVITAPTRSIALDRRVSMPAPVPAPRTQAAAAQPNIDAATRPAASASTAVPISRPLDLRLPEATLRFEHDPLARRGPPIEAHQNRMTLQFVDRSLGGTWRRMTQASICSELRRALRTAGGGADGVIESMRENGCPV